jgi:DNA-binding transcriptional regulator YdaS (Cro superfamily)
MSTREVIERAIALAGSEAKLGLGTGFSQVAINKAKHKGHASAEMALAIHRFLNGSVSAADLRPDLWARHADATRAANLLNSEDVA